MNAVVAPVALASPLPGDKLGTLELLLKGLSPDQLYWVAARSAGLAVGTLPAASAQELPAEARVTVIFGSQTGNARRLAERLRDGLAQSGLAVRLVRADSYDTRELVRERLLFIVASTQGEGEPSDDARALVDFLGGRRAPKLPDLRYGVLGLGDSSYPQFCAIGQQVDARLATLGATRLLPLAQADVDIEPVAEPWLGKAVVEARGAIGLPAAPRFSIVPSSVAALTGSREAPFAAPILANQRIVARDSLRDVRHVELSLEGSGLQYEPGDALGVWPTNPPTLVSQWLETLGLRGDEEVAHLGRSLPLAKWLSSERELTRLTRGFLAAHAAASGSDELMRLLRPGAEADLKRVLATWQPIDVLQHQHGIWDADAIVQALRPLTPRLYSIASSPRAVEHEVHLTVSVVDYLLGAERRHGAASRHLADLGEDATARVFVESNERFRLPPDEARDIIMIGAGTGVAPYRAFVQERRERGSSGRNWLLFGNRHFASDFLYQTEWLEALRKGALQRLDLAFSRDGADKIYVQHRLLEQGASIHAWLRDGAHLYVCGDANHMARDVHEALLVIGQTHGGLDREQSAEWLAELMKEGRYARDVY